MSNLRKIFNTSKKMVISAVCTAEILLIPGGLTACSTNNSNAADYVTLEKAEEIALADAEVTASDITSIKTKSDTANQENVPDETKQDMVLAEETRPDTTSASSKSLQDTNLSDATEQNTTQSGVAQQDTTKSGAAQQTTPSDTAAQSESAQPNETQPTPDAKGQISLDDAKKAALADAGLSSSDVIYTKEKLDYEDGIAVYDIEFYTSTMDYEYEIHATTGAIHSKDAETHHTGTGHGNHTQTSGTYIGDDNAKSIALNHAGISASDVTLLKSELDTDDGQVVYEVEFYKDGREYEYKINASDGTILKYEVD